MVGGVGGPKRLFSKLASARWPTRGLVLTQIRRVLEGILDPDAPFLCEEPRKTPRKRKPLNWSPRANEEKEEKKAPAPASAPVTSQGARRAESRDSARGPAKPKAKAKAK